MIDGKELNPEQAQWIKQLLERAESFKEVFGEQSIEQEFRETSAALAASERLAEVPPYERANIMYMHDDIKQLILMLARKPKDLH